MSTENTQWLVTVHPSPEADSADGVINLPHELSGLLFGKKIPYSLAKDRSITLHITKATPQD